MLRASMLGLYLLSTSLGMAEPPQIKPLVPDTRTFELTPAAEPIPTFKYRFYPVEALRKPGNAVPIYLRFAHERNTEAKKSQLSDTYDLLSAPDDKFDLAASRQQVDRWARILRQMDHAARKQMTDFSYTIDEEREQVFGTLLGDAQELRGHHRLVCLKARVEIAEGKINEAVRTIETAFAMSAQLAEGPFLINGLIGTACGSQSADQVENLIRRPGSPNLFWALATLPRPTISMRRGLDTEYALGEIGFPEFQGLDTVQGEKESDARLARVTERLAQLSEVSSKLETGKQVPDKAAETRAHRLELARKFLISRQIATAEHLKGLPDAQVILLGIRSQYAETRDARFKGLLLPLREARQFEATPSPIAPDEEVVPLTTTLLPLLDIARRSEANLERRVAALRLIEALRMHAKANQGKLPASLDEVKIVSIPDDPTTNRPFSYKLENEKATIESPRYGAQVPELKYQVSMRK